MPPKKILLNDGTELEIDWCGASDGVLWADGLHLTLMEAIAIFSDITKTCKIVAPIDIIHTGYTKLIHLNLSFEGLTKVALRKEG